MSQMELSPVAEKSGDLPGKKQNLIWAMGKLFSIKLKRSQIFSRNVILLKCSLLMCRLSLDACHFLIHCLLRLSMSWLALSPLWMMFLGAEIASFAH